MAGWGAYNASKAAMNSLGRTLANEEEDLVVVSVRPGVVGTEMQEKIREIGKFHPLTFEIIGQRWSADQRERK